MPSNVCVQNSTHFYPYIAAEDRQGITCQSLTVTEKDQQDEAKGCAVEQRHRDSNCPFAQTIPDTMENQKMSHAGAKNTSPCR